MAKMQVGFQKHRDRECTTVRHGINGVGYEVFQQGLNLFLIDVDHGQLIGKYRDEVNIRGNFQ